MRLVATEPLKAGEQMPYHYGWCSNRFFLINYGFFIPKNPMDAVVIRVRDPKAEGQDKIVLLHRGAPQKKFIELCYSLLTSIPTLISHDSPSALRLPTLTYALALVEA
jgi:hypothetical protein